VTVYEDNPAGRLYQLIKKLDRVPGTTGVRDAWIAALDARNMAIVSRRIVEVLKLPAQIESELQQVDDGLFDRDFAMRWLQPVEETFSEMLFSNEQIGSRKRYGVEAMLSLENASYVLHVYRRESAPSNDDLASIRQLIDEIEKIAAQSGDIDSDLRAFLLKYARAMRIAVDDYFILGPQAMESAVDEGIGAAIRHGYIPNEAGDDSGAGAERKAAIKKFWGMLTHVALVLSLTANLAAIAQTAYSDTESHSQPQQQIEKIVNYDNSPPGGVVIIENNADDVSKADVPKQSGG
jgi:hypothetical protein